MIVPGGDDFVVGLFQIFQFKWKKGKIERKIEMKKIEDKVVLSASILRDSVDWKSFP